MMKNWNSESGAVDVKQALFPSVVNNTAQDNLAAANELAKKHTFLSHG